MPEQPRPSRPATPTELAEITEVTLERDTVAFANEDWDLVADDFDEAAFVGYDGSAGSDAPWQLAFPDLATYRAEWLRQAAAMRAAAEPDRIIREVRAACRIAEVQVAGNRALVRKEFAGTAVGQRLNWRTYYFLRRDSGRWRITGFVGYLPPPAD